MKCVEILKENHNDVKNPMFLEIWDKHKNIGLAQYLDMYLHPDYVTDVKQYGISVLWKKPFPNAVVGDIIRGDRVVSVNTFTILVKGDDDWGCNCCYHK